MKYAFRVRFTRSPRDAVNADVPALDLPSPGAEQSVQLLAAAKESSIKDSPTLLLVGEGFSSETEATTVGDLYTRVLVRTLAHLRVGVDFGARAARSVFTKFGLAWIEKQVQQRVLIDVHGLMVFPAEPWPKFAAVTLEAVRGVPRDRFERSFRRGLETGATIDDREQVALELFNASFFQASPDGRFVLLFMAVEALLQPDSRPAPVLQYVESLIAATKAQKCLPVNERDSLLGSLQWLRLESISRTGKKLAERRLAGRAYQNHDPAQFFSECYSVRNRLVHGQLPFPTREEVDGLAAGLEQFVADLLAGPLLDVE